MPLEIRELVIRTQVNTQAPSSPGVAAGEPMDKLDRQLLVKDCVREVLRHLRRRSEK